MATSARIIRRRIKSVANTRKITKAMELVSAAKMRRAVGLATAARRYAALGNALLKNLSALGATVEHPFFRRAGQIKKVLCVVIGSDRGLCGAYNASLLRAIEAAMSAFPEVDYAVAGRHAELSLRRSGAKVIASFAGLTNAPRAAAIRPLSGLAQTEFLAETYDAVYVASTEYVSALRQAPSVREMLPLAPLRTAAAASEPAATAEEGLSPDALFEPDPRTVLEYTLPRFIEAGIYQAVLEAAASEHSARMMSMRNASDAAGDMLDDLTFTLNQARQSAITSEIAEISAGRAALEG